MNRNRLKYALSALETCGFETNFTAGIAVENLVTSIPHYDAQVRIFHDLNHIFANAVYGTMDEEDPVFILQASLSGKKLELAQHEKPEYLELARQMQSRADVILGFFQTLTGLESIKDLSEIALSKMPLCMFAIVPDEKPLRNIPGRFAYRLMSLEERRNVIETFEGNAKYLGLKIDPEAEALAEAPERIFIPIEKMDEPAPAKT